MDTNEVKTALEAGLNGIKAQLESAITKHEEQVKAAGSAASEVKAEVNALAQEFAKAQAKILEIQQKGITQGRENVEPSTLGANVIGTDEYKSFSANSNRDARFRVEVKNTVDSGATTVFPFQKPGVVPGAFKPLGVRQSLIAIPVSSNSVEYLRESAFTNSAAEASHGAAKNDSDITFSNETCTIRTVAHWIKVTNQLLADAPAVAAYIDTRLRDGLAQRIDYQLINGNGTSPNLSGFTDSGNFTAYSPTSGDTLVDAINRIKYTMWAAGYAPDVVYVNPADWGEMERTRESAGGGQYLYGAPGMNAGLNPFGLRIVISKDLAAGKVIVLQSSSALVYDRSAVAVEMGYVNDDFTKNLVTLRAEERLGLAVERPAGVYYGDFTA